MFTHSLQKARDSRPNKNVDLANLTFNLDRQDYVGIFDWLELRVNQRFVKIQDKSFSTNITLSLRPDQKLVIFRLFGLW